MYPRLASNSWRLFVLCFHTRITWISCHIQLQTFSCLSILVETGIPTPSRVSCYLWHFLLSWRVSLSALQGQYVLTWHWKMDTINILMFLRLSPYIVIHTAGEPTPHQQSKLTLPKNLLQKDPLNSTHLTIASSPFILLSQISFS